MEHNIKNDKHTAVAILLRFYALTAPCLLSLSEDFMVFGITYTIIVLAALNTTDGRKYFRKVVRAYNSIFTFDKI